MCVGFVRPTRSSLGLTCEVGIESFVPSMEATSSTEGMRKLRMSDGVRPG